MRPIYLLFLILIGLLILGPYQDCQQYLASGDHGRDLYAAQAIWRGEMPYKDFWWVYGPLTPYLYGLCYALGGVHITSLIAGKLALTLLGAVFFFLGLSTLISPIAALGASLWFLIFRQDFFFTYNHIAGICAIMAIFWALCLYLTQRRMRFAYWALLPIFILGLIKINFCITALITTVLLIVTTDAVYKISFNSAKKFFYCLALIGLPFLLYAIYAMLLNGLSTIEIRQCFPYFNDDQPYNVSAWDALQSFAQTIWNTMTSNWLNISMAIIILGSLGRSLFLLLNKQLPINKSKILILTLGLLGFWYVANFHEFLKSGVVYRSYWCQPLSIALCFVLIDVAISHSHALLRKIVIGLLGFIAFAGIITNNQHLNEMRTTRQTFDVDGKTIYLSNPPAWIDTVKETTAFLNKTLAPDELFFALPYDCLYYYLTGKRTPTRQLIFFQHIKIPVEQERSIIAELEKNRVNYVLISSRAFVHQEYGLGILGKDYCPLIAAYIEKNFAPLERFGDWSHEPGWAWNHGTLILKRK